MSDPDPRPVLEAALRRARARLADLTGDYAGMVEASRDSHADDEHHQIGELEAALVRVEDATYGVCEVCGTQIPPARLEARPTARTCITHAR